MFERNTNVGFDFDWSTVSDTNVTKKNLTTIYDYLKANKHLVEWQHIYNVNGVPFYLNSEEENIGITLSGGADSTMILYILCSLIDDLKLNTTIHAITMIRFWRDRTYIEDLVTGIIDFIRAKFPRIKIVPHYGFVPTALETTPLANLNLKSDPIYCNWTEDHIKDKNADVYAVSDYSYYICSRYNIRSCYSGTTTNPGHVIPLSPEFRRVKEISSIRFELEYSRRQINKRATVSPIEHVQKNWVMAQYENFSLQDLMMLTRSCEGSTVKMNSVFGKNKWHARGSQYVCRACFFCKEREWAWNERTPFLIKK